MKFRLSSDPEVKKATEYLIELVDKKAVVEIKKVNPKRTLSQNSYLHLLLGAFGLHFGYTLEEAKFIYKRLNRDTYYYKKKKQTFIRSSADLNKEEMAKTIDVFMKKSAEAGYELPLATNQEWIQQIENEIERGSKYL